MRLTVQEAWSDEWGKLYFCPCFAPDYLSDAIKRNSEFLSIGGFLRPRNYRIFRSNFLNQSWRQFSRRRFPCSSLDRIFHVSARCSEIKMFRIATKFIITFVTNVIVASFRDRSISEKIRNTVNVCMRPKNRTKGDVRIRFRFRDFPPGPAFVRVFFISNAIPKTLYRCLTLFFNYVKKDFTTTLKLLLCHEFILAASANVNNRKL